MTNDAAAARSQGLWFLKDEGFVNHATGLARTIEELNPTELAALYRTDRSEAPRRGERGLAFFVNGHDGRPHSGSWSNRQEEHLMLSLFWRCAAGGRLPGEVGSRLRILDYQVPLKAHAKDSTGKIDAVGLLDGRLSCLIELKVRTRQRGDSPLRAMLEAFAYAAVIEANRKEFDEELSAICPEYVTGSRLVLLVLGPQSWWEAWRTCAAAGEWRPALGGLARELGRLLDVDVAFALLGGFEPDHLSFGLSGERPTLRPFPQIRSVEGLPTLPAPFSYRRETDTGPYRRNLLGTTRAYVRYAGLAIDRFDRSDEVPGRPPVLKPEFATDNLVLPPGDDARRSVVAVSSDIERHRWFGDFFSSQALTVSVFGGLAATGHLRSLVGLSTDCGRPAFGDLDVSSALTLEKEVRWLSEPRPTMVDAWVEGPGPLRVAVECKLTEPGFGRCSRPDLSPEDHRFIDFCDGSYRVQGDRTTRCSLTERAIAYWRHIPSIMEGGWEADRDHDPCPMDRTYQLVRNVLAAAVLPNGGIELEHAHALVVYDRRNPAFMKGGEGYLAISAVRAGLMNPGLLRSVSWQALARHFGGEPGLSWLVEGLEAKYGIEGA